MLCSGGLPYHFYSSTIQNGTPTIINNTAVLVYYCNSKTKRTSTKTVSMRFTERNSRVATIPCTEVITTYCRRVERIHCQIISTGWAGILYLLLPYLPCTRYTYIIGVVCPEAWYICTKQIRLQSVRPTPVRWIDKNCFTDISSSCSLCSTYSLPREKKAL